MKGKIAVSSLNEIKVAEFKPVVGYRPAWNVIIKGPDEYRHPAWSPDGKLIALSFMSSENAKPDNTSGNPYYQLVSIDPDGKNIHTLLKGQLNYDYPAWSPNGQYVSVIANPNWPEKVEGKVCLLNRITGKDECIENLNVHIARPAWSLDSDLLTFTTADLSVVLYDVKKSYFSVLPQKGTSPIFHPDGQRIYYVQSDNQALISVKLDGSEMKIVKRMFIDYLVAFSKDGNFLLYIGGGHRGFILPGPEYSTIELLDLRSNESRTIDTFSVIYGVTWVE